MKKVSIVIVNWNRVGYLKDCLKSLSKISYKNTEIIVVDNASTDGSVEFVKKNYPKIKLVRNKSNLGFAGGNNAALSKITGDYVLFLNNDTTVDKHFLEPLVKVLDEDKNLGVVQSKILTMEDHKKLDAVGGYFTLTGFLYHYGYYQRDSKKYSHQLNMYSIKGASMMTRMSLVKKIGLFDHDFFAYFEETDFCHRVWLSGFSVKYIPDSIIYHKIGGTSNSMNNAFIQFHSFKNRINTYLKNLGLVQLIIVLPIHLLLCELAGFGFILKRKPGHFVAINKAILWNVTTISKTLRKRKKVQSKIRVVSDKEIFAQVKKNPPLRYYYYLFAKSLVGYKE